jgi:hypothetical protein
MQALGYAVLSGPSGIQEADTFTCAHCQRIEHMPPKSQPPKGGMCRLCMKLVCENCIASGICDPFEKKLERIEKQDRFRRQLGI